MRVTVPHRGRAARGSATALALFLVITVGGLSVGLLHESFAGGTTLRRHDSNGRALEIAEAGLVKAEMEILAQKDSGMDGIGAYAGTYSGGTVAVTAVVDASAPNLWVMTAKATHRLSTRTLVEQIKRIAPSPFIWAAFGKDGLSLAASRSDAYDSRLGTYASQATHVDSGGIYALTGASVGSNKGIVLTGTTLVRGDALPGPGYTTAGALGHLTGSSTPMTIPFELPITPIADFQAAQASPSNGTWTSVGGFLAYDASKRTLAISGTGTLTLNAGTYFVTDLIVSGNSILKITGDVKLYATGKVDLSGGTLLNLTGKPEGFQIYSHPYTALVPAYVPPVTSVTISGGTGAYFLSYGPESPLTLSGGGHVYGSFIGKTVTNSGGSAIHYDKALAELGPSTPTLRHLYWREPSLPRR